MKKIIILISLVVAVFTINLNLQPNTNKIEITYGIEQAHAGFFDFIGDFLGGVVEWISDGVRAVTRIIGNALRGVVESMRAAIDFVQNPSLETWSAFVQEVVTRVTSLNCNYEKLYGIDLLCFHGEEHVKIRTALNVIAEMDAPININGIRSLPIDHLRQRLSAILSNDYTLNILGMINEVKDLDFAAFTTLNSRGPMLITSDYLLNASTINVVGTLVHEAGHHVFGQHSDGLYNDKDDNTVYGLGEKFKMKIFFNGIARGRTLTVHGCDDMSIRFQKVGSDRAAMTSFYYTHVENNDITNCVR